jgi:hypothetical protein
MKKVKPEHYSLISNDWIDKKIESLEQISQTRLEGFVEGKYVGQLRLLKELKEQMIPSIRLADKCFEEGSIAGMALTISKQTEHKETFLKSDIEI